MDKFNKRKNKLDRKKINKNKMIYNSKYIRKQEWKQNLKNTQNSTKVV